MRIKLLCHYFANKGLSSQGYGFSCGHVWMWESDCEESWVPKNWCFWTVVLEKALESPLDCKEIQPVHPKGDQSWVSIGRTDFEESVQVWNSETPILWPPDAKSWLIWKDPDAGKDWGQEKGTTEDEMAGWHHWLSGQGFGWTLGVGDGQGGLACYGSWGRKESDTTEQLKWTELNWTELNWTESLWFYSVARKYSDLLTAFQNISRWTTNEIIENLKYFKGSIYYFLLWPSMFVLYDSLSTV